MLHGISLKGSIPSKPNLQTNEQTWFWMYHKTAVHISHKFSTYTYVNMNSDIFCQLCHKTVLSKYELIIFAVNSMCTITHDCVSLSTCTMNTQKAIELYLCISISKQHACMCNYTLTSNKYFQVKFTKQYIMKHSQESAAYNNTF